MCKLELFHAHLQLILFPQIASWYLNYLLLSDYLLDQKDIRHLTSSAHVSLLAPWGVLDAFLYTLLAITGRTLEEQQSGWDILHYHDLVKCSKFKDISSSVFSDILVYCIFCTSGFVNLIICNELNFLILWSCFTFFLKSLSLPPTFSK